MRICSQCGTRFSEPVTFCPHDGTSTREVADEGPRDPYLGRVIDGRYRVEAVLGEGGMGVVYQISHVTLGKRMALKVLRGEMARDTDVVQRFIQEAQSATQIGHPNIIDISDFGRLPDQSAYFVMEYLDGVSLTQMIARGGSVPAQRALHIVRQIASALEAAHERGIVHRDLKPDNIFILKRGSDTDFVKVLDFGIAKVGGAASKLTKTGMIFGTPHYMSPEQAAGHPVDRRTDIYALGVIMYEMFAGRVPFEGDTFMGILSKHMFQEPVPPSQVRGASLGALEHVILKALAKKVEARYQTMSELIGDIDRVSATGVISVGGCGIQPPGNLANVLEPPSRTEMRLGRESADESKAVPARRGPWVLGGLMLVLLLAGAVGGAVVLHRSSDALDSREASTSSPAADASDTRTSAAEEPSMSTAAPAPTSSAVALPQGGTAPATSSGLTAIPSAPSASGSGVASGADPIAAVAIESEPPGAEVLVDGALLGRTPVLVPRPTSGERQVMLRLRGYQDARVVVVPTSSGELSVRLERALVHGSGSRTSAMTSTAQIITAGTSTSPTVPTSPPMTEAAPPSTAWGATRTRPRSEVVDPWE